MKLKNFGAIILWYLKFWAKLHLFIIRPVILGVGGASGKTSLSHFLYLILSEKYKVRQTYGKNSQTGIPLSALGLNPQNYTILDWLKVVILAPFKALFDFEKFEIFIAELGIDSPNPPNNMSYLLNIVRPSVATLTNIAFEHSENFDSLVLNKKNRESEILKLTAKEEGQLLTSLPKNGWAVLNIDDPKIKELKKNIKANIISISTQERKADLFGQIFLNQRFKLNFMKNGQTFTFFLPTPIPLHYANSLLASFAICEKLGIPIDSSIKTLKKKFSLPPGRFTIFSGIKNTKILDSTYNSSLIPAIDALFVLHKMNGKRKVAIMGDMRELGSVSRKEHEVLAKELLKTTDFVILIGPLMRKYVAPILKNNNHKYYSFLTFSESRNTIRKAINSGDLILVKGSQNTLYLERVVEMLLLNKKDKIKLCRRGDFWDKKRKETP